MKHSLPVPTREQCIEAVYHLENAAKKALLGYYLHGDSPEEYQQEDRRVYHASEIFEYLNKAASALGLHVSAQPAAPPRAQTEQKEWFEPSKPAAQQPPFVRPDSEREFSGPFVDDGPPAQQPSDLVKRLRGFNTAYDSKRHILEAADRIEALEADQKSLRLHIAELTEQLDIAKAAAAQPSREAELVKAARPFAEEAKNWDHERYDVLAGVYQKMAFKISEVREIRAALAAYDTPAKDEREQDAALVRALEAISCGQYPEAQNIERTGHYFEAFKAVQEIASEALAAYDTPAKDERLEWPEVNADKIRADINAAAEREPVVSETLDPSVDERREEAK